jgi:hypothetical protein
MPIFQDAGSVFMKFFELFLLFVVCRTFSNNQGQRMNYDNFETDFDQELKLELEKLDQIFLSNHEPSLPTHLNNSRTSAGGGQSTLDELEADIEKEELHDKLQAVLSQAEDHSKQIMQLTGVNMELKSRNDQLQRETERLLQRIADLEQNQAPVDSPRSHRTEEEFRQVEFKLAETRSKLARSQQAFDDLVLAKDSALLELEKERMIRLHIEKERDAYSAAYEQSLNHFEKWTSKSKSRFTISR